MTDTERFFIDILSSHISDTPLSAPQNADYAELTSLSHAHKLTPIVYSELAKKLKDEVPEDFLSGLKRTAYMQITGQISKSRAFLDAYTELSHAGIKCVVVKGITLRVLYPDPDLRLSSDEDVLVPEEDFENACKALLDHGFEEREKTDEDTNVRAFSNVPSGLLIELHNSLFPHTDAFNENMASLFDGAADRSREQIIDGCKIYTLSPTDSLLFLILHSFKHFVFCGFGLRQIADLIVFARANKSLTDAKYIISSLEKVRALGFFKALVGICEEYFKVSAEELGFEGLETQRIDTSDLIADVLSGGAYGNSSPERVHSSLMTLTSANGGKKSSALRAVFPPYSVMKERYPFVAKNRILLPAAWCARIFKRVFSEKGSYSNSAALEIGHRRVEMLKKYGVIE